MTSSPKKLVNYFLELLKPHEHEFKMLSIRKVEDWRVSQNLNTETWSCVKCGLKQYRSGYNDEHGKPQEKIPALEGECELSFR